MYIAIHGNIDVGMSENLTETFDIKAYLHAAGCERMAQCVKIDRRDGKFLQYAFEMILHDSWLQEMALASGQHISTVSFKRVLTKKEFVT